MKTITSIEEYCAEVNIPSPKHPFFDIRKFEENMLTVNETQAPFRHEFYAIALRFFGSNKEVMGKPLSSNLFFNSPYQIITWDIKPDWEGWYILFDKNFIAQNPNWLNFTVDFPFFRLDKTIPFDLEKDDQELANLFFTKIYEEYHSNNSDKFLFIQSYTQLLLHLTKRYFLKLDVSGEDQENRTADILLLSRFQSILENEMANEKAPADVRQASYYAEKLSVHPNHLNTVAKRISGNTVSQLIQKQLILTAKSLLQQTNFSSKEIAYRLHFSEPTHFNAFFKKNVGITPQQYRDSLNL